jgi:hypothetical protein
MTGSVPRLLVILLRSLAVLLGALLVLLPRPARAAAFDVNDATWEGCSELLDIARGELGETRVLAVGVLDWDQVKPEDGVLALHPEQAMDPDETAAFMKAGGRLAIVDDFGRGDETLRRFKIERASVPSRPVSALRNNPNLAIAEPVIEGSSGPHPVVANVPRLVTNHPTGLRHPNLSPVLRIRAIGEQDAIIAVAGQVEKGRLFAMSDPSAVINLMLRYPGNRAFVAGLVRYLLDDEGGSRGKGRLFIVSNRFDEHGAFGGQSSMRKDIEEQLHALANALADAREHGLPGWLHIALAGFVVLALAGWTARNSARAYKSALPRYARATPLVAQGGAAGRFAMLAAPSSPRSLALMELKSALFEALALRFDLDPDPSVDRITGLVRREAGLEAQTFESFKGMLAAMSRVEASVVAGRPAKVPRTLLADAARMCAAVLAACGADAPQRGVGRAVRPEPAPEDDASQPASEGKNGE